ncbi:hydroxyethylthiazole kinase [Desulfitispora alkaliphila]|uniref:hydroxyethylthiazole kinase n=1 Tax=Desulfitispora alkaliphila TaxID=622674 RepID=UPI003D21B143
MDVFDTLREVKRTKPLVHHITNAVVMNDTANITLQIGASPVMANAKEEVEEMVSIASGLVLNIGTLTPVQVEAMILAGKKANEIGIPIVFDPVGVGATSYRTQVANRILEELDVAIICGNSAEVCVLAGVEAQVKGVDAGEIEGEVGVAAKSLAQKTGSVVAATGPIDYITDGTKVAECRNGHPMLEILTGTGCMVTSVIAACAAVTDDYMLAATAGVTAFGISGQLAAESAGLPGNFKVKLFDSTYSLTQSNIEKQINIKIK